ncbi:hypothetical protein [Aquibacillus albus]|uniref:Ser/Thr protein kinase n=1 Tax=Aquibacillus albus TaxID=1168171 RepID=A0ABS2N659_9BACI|nr:hypothetical protein [Aquibacillus albus]MBM7573637.1 putative Ser/Thr protein kinase [Aquibacillus albus]
MRQTQTERVTPRTEEEARYLERLHGFTVVPRPKPKKEKHEPKTSGNTLDDLAREIRQARTIIKLVGAAVIVEGIGLAALFIALL